MIKDHNYVSVYDPLSFGFTVLRILEVQGSGFSIVMDAALKPLFHKLLMIAS